MKHEPDTKKHQLLHTVYLAASGQARPRKDLATLLGVHGHSVAAWFHAYAHRGLAQALGQREGTLYQASRVVDF